VAAKRLYVNAWADWNGNGSWADAGEKIIGVGSPNPGNEIDPQDFGPDGEFTIGEAFPDPNGSGRWEPGEPFTDEAGFTEGSKEFTVTPPATISGTFFLRFRLDYGEDAGRLANVSGNLAQEKGAAQFGEVEDYQVSVPDHYLCYTSTTMDEKPPIVTLEDQFETAMFQPRRCRPKSFCTPAAKNGVPITDPVTHLKAYKIRRLQPGPEPQVTADVTNQFGTLRVQTVRALRMLVPSSKGLTEMPPSPDPAAPGFEHYKCYRIRVLGQVVGGVVTGRFAPIAVSSIGDQFDDARDDVQLRRVTTLCTPASKNGSTVRDRNRHLLCYSMRRSNDPGKVFVNNQFGPQEMNVKGESAFCVPSLKTLVP
jgi:hypothetical protein